jgi:RNA 2',3'-cyclic 3'-phosphodiesterase
VSGRFFVAVDLDEPSRDFVAGAIERMQEAGLDARFVAREKWHATLAFLGKLPPEQYPPVVEALSAAAATRPAFYLSLDAIGAFPNQTRPRVIWVGSSTAQPMFAACANGVRGTLAPLGISFDDDAVPHVTVCRMKHPSKALPQVVLPQGVRVFVDSLTLYESVPGGSTTRYEVRERLPLRLHQM